MKGRVTIDDEGAISLEWSDRLMVVFTPDGGAAYSNPRPGKPFGEVAEFNPSEPWPEELRELLELFR